MRSIYKREIASFFQNPTAALFLFAVTAIVGGGAWYSCVKTGYRTVQQAVSWLCAGYVVLVPLLMCDMFAGEKRRGTDRVLLSSPIRVGEIVTGKYLAYVTLLLLACVLCCLFPIMLCVTASAPMGENLLCILEAFLFGAFLMAVMTHLSAMAPSRLIALGAGVAGLALLNFLTEVAQSLPTDTRMLILLVASVVGIGLLASKNLAISFAAAVAAMLPIVVGKLMGTNAVLECYGKALTAVSPTLTLRAFASGILDPGCVLYCVTGIVILLLLATVSANQKGSGLRRAAK